MRPLRVVEHEPDGTDHPSLDTERDGDRGVRVRRKRRGVGEHRLELLAADCTQRPSLARGAVQHAALGQPEHLPLGELESLGVGDDDVAFLDEAQRERSADHRRRLLDEGRDDVGDARRGGERRGETLQGLDARDRLVGDIGLPGRPDVRASQDETDPDHRERDGETHSPLYPRLAPGHVERVAFADDEHCGARPGDDQADDPGPDAAVPHRQRNGADEDRIDRDLPLVRQHHLRHDGGERSEHRERIPQERGLVPKALELARAVCHQRRS